MVLASGTRFGFGFWFGFGLGLGLGLGLDLVLHLEELALLASDLRLRLGHL